MKYPERVRNKKYLNYDFQNFLSNCEQNQSYENFFLIKAIIKKNKKECFLSLILTLLNRKKGNMKHEF